MTTIYDYIETAKKRQDAIREAHKSRNEYEIAKAIVLSKELGDDLGLLRGSLSQKDLQVVKFYERDQELFDAMLSGFNRLNVMFASKGYIRPEDLRDALDKIQEVLDRGDNETY